MLVGVHVVEVLDGPMGGMLKMGSKNHFESRRIDPRLNMLYTVTRLL